MDIHDNVKLHELLLEQGKRVQENLEKHKDIVAHEFSHDVVSLHVRNHADDTKG